MGGGVLMVVCVCACFFQNYSTEMHEHDILLRRARADIGTSAQSPPLPPLDLSKAAMVESMMFTLVRPLLS